MKISYNPKSSLTAITTETAANDDIIFDLYASKLWAKGVRIGADWADISSKPSSLKNPYALTISLNGTSQGPYDGSAAKSIDITPSSIGAATSGHNHDGRYVYNYGSTEMDGASKNKNALGMSTTSGISGDWWHILQAAWNDEYRWNSLIAFPTLNRNGMYYRSGLDDNTAWGDWVKLLDVNNSYVTGGKGYINGTEITLVNNASKLQTARNLWGNSFNGTADISGTIKFNNVTSGLCEGILWTCGDNDLARIKAGATGSNAGYLEIATADDGNEPIYVRQYTGVFGSVKRTLTLLDASGYTHFPGYINIGGNENNNSSPDRVWGSNGSDSYLRSYRTSALRVAYAVNANSATTASSANKLTTARNITLGTDLRGSANFDGSSNITINATINSCSVNIGSTDTLHFKRIAHFETANSYNDNALLLYISLGYINGNNGICRVEFRTDNISKDSTSVTASAAVRWLVRNGYGLDSLYAGYYVTTGKAYIDIYLKTTGGYQGTVIRVLLDSRGGINSNVLLINSHYYSDSDHKEAYNSIEAASTALYNRAYTKIVSGSDVGTVNYANVTGSANSATKLLTARKLWGLSFDGSNNVDGTLTMLSTFTSSGIYPSNNYILLKVTNGDSAWEAARIGTYIAANNGNTGGYPAGLAFYTKPADGSNSSSTELRMVIDANGNVGIGTTSPAYKLDVIGDAKITGSIRNLAIGGGIYWNPYVESTTDSSDAASITVVRAGVAGGTTLVFSLYNDANDTILFKTNDAARLYHNNNFILTSKDTKVTSGKGYIDNTEITQVNNADTVDNRHAISTTPNTGIIYKAAIYTSSSLTSYWVRLASISSINLNSEFVATIHVLSGHSNPGRSAILLVYLRGGTSSFISKSFKICCNSNYDPNRFRLYYKDSDKTSEIWYQTTGLWDGIITTVISLSSEGSLYEGLTLYSGNITVVQTPSVSTYLSALVSTITDNISGNAATATNADKVDGYHASGLWRSDGATWNPGANVSLTANGNNQEWSFDIRRNGYTGCYWHVLDSTLNTLLKVNADNGKVYAPYNFVGNLEGNASTASKWTNARTFTIGNTAKNVDGSGNVSWSLAEIGVNDTWRTVQVNGTSIGNNTLNLCGSTYIGLTNVNGKVTFSLVGSGTTANQAILSNGTANEWTLKTLNIDNWDTAYNFVSTITGDDTDDIINKWDEIVNFLESITEDNKLNTLLSSKLSILLLAAKEILTTKTNNALYWVNTKGTASSITTGPFTDHPYALLSVTNYNQNDANGKFFYRSRLAFSSSGDLKVASCHHENEYKLDETWYNVLTSKNSGINGSTIKLNGTSITVYSSSTADGRYVKKSGDTMSGALNFANNIWNQVGDDVAIGDHNVAGCLGIKGLNAGPGLAFYNSSNTLLSKLVGTANLFLRVSGDNTYNILDNSTTHINDNTITINGTSLTVSKSDHNHDDRYLKWLGNAGKSNMNDIGRISHSSGMTDLSDPGNTIDNPMEGGSKSTSWHLYWLTNYTDNPSGSNAWVALIVNRAGTDRWWVRSRSGGTITNGTDWNSNWRFLVTAPTSGLGGSSLPVYINSAGEVVAANSYPTSLKSPHALTLKANGTILATYDGSSAKEANFTYANVGAASANHNHDERYVRKWTGVYGHANKFLKLVISDEKGWIRLEVSDSNNALSGGYGIYMIGWGWHGDNNTDNLVVYCLYANDSRYITALKVVRTSRNNYDFYFLFASNSSYPSYTINYSSSVSSIDCTVTAVDTIPTATWTSSLSALQLNASQVDWSGITNKPSTFNPAEHTHTVFKNNLMIKGTNGISDSASIHLGIGDSDTGFKWISNGKCLIYANNVAVGEWTSGGMNWFKNPTVNGNKVWNAGNDGSGSGLDADTVDGYHATDGRTFNGNINWSEDWRDLWNDGTNHHPWYGFDHRYAKTGVYSTTLSDYFGLTLKTGSGNISMTNNGNVGIGLFDPIYKLLVAGNVYASDKITSTGFVHSSVTENADLYVLTADGGYTFLNLTSNELAHEFSKDIIVTSEWTDIEDFYGGNLNFLTLSGTYIVLVYYTTNSANSMYEGYFSGIMSWYTGTTNSNNADEIVLHRVGHAYANTIYLRTRESLNSESLPYTKLQISANSDLKQHTYKFKFKRIC